MGRNSAIESGAQWTTSYASPGDLIGTGMVRHCIGQAFSMQFASKVHEPGSQSGKISCEWSAGTLQYTGHIEHGTIVLDDAPALQDGVRVRVALTVLDTPEAAGMPLRGTQYRYDDPFSPALRPEDWDAVQ